MRLGLAKAWMVGVGVLIAVALVWAVLLKLEIYSQFMAIFLWLSPGAAAFAAAYLGPSRKFLLGASMGVPAALLGVAFNSAWQLRGNEVDFPGAGGGLMLFALILVGATVISSLGALAGCFVKRDSA